LPSPDVSNLTEFALSKSNYSELTTRLNNTFESSFAIALFSKIPSTNELRRYSEPREGVHARLYWAGDNEHPFIVKKFNIPSKSGSPEEEFSEIINQQQRAGVFFGPYLPITVFYKRLTTIGKMEYLAAQDFISGSQFKIDIMDKGKLIELTTKMRDQLVDIAQRAVTMYNETGFTLHADFMFDVKKEQIKIFDTEDQVRSRSALESYLSAVEACGVTLHPEVRKNISNRWMEIEAKQTIVLDSLG